MLTGNNENADLKCRNSNKTLNAQSGENTESSLVGARRRSSRTNADENNLNEKVHKEPASTAKLKRKKSIDYAKHFDSNSSNIPATSNNNSQNVNETINSQTDELNANLEFKIGEVVWAKFRTYPFWPAKIIDIIVKSIPNESTPNPNSKTNYRIGKTKIEYRVEFYDDANTKCNLLSDKVKQFECENKHEFMKKAQDTPLLAEAIQQAVSALSNSKLAESSSSNSSKRKRNQSSSSRTNFDDIGKTNEENEECKKKMSRLSISLPLNSHATTGEEQKNSAMADLGAAERKPKRSSALLASKMLKSSAIQKNPTPNQLRKQKLLQMNDEERISLREKYEKLRAENELAISNSQLSNQKIVHKKSNKKRAKQSASLENSQTRSKKQNEAVQNTSNEENSHNENDDEEMLGLTFNKKPSCSENMDNLSESDSFSPVNLSFDLASEEEFFEQYKKIAIVLSSSDVAESIDNGLLKRLIGELRNKLILSNSIYENHDQHKPEISVYDFSLSEENEEIKSLLDEEIQALNDGCGNGSRFKLNYCNSKSDQEFCDLKSTKCELIFLFLSDENEMHFDQFKNALFDAELKNLQLVAFSSLKLKTLAGLHFSLKRHDSVLYEAACLAARDNRLETYTSCPKDGLLYKLLAKITDRVHWTESLGQASVIVREKRKRCLLLSLADEYLNYDMRNFARLSGNDHLANEATRNSFTNSSKDNHKIVQDFIRFLHSQIY